MMVDRQELMETMSLLILLIKCLPIYKEHVNLVELDKILAKAEDVFERM